MNGTKSHKTSQLGQGIQEWNSWSILEHSDPIVTHYNCYHGYYHYYYYFELEVTLEKSKIHSPISGQCFISIPPRNV